MLAFALIISSCQLGRQYERPELNLPDKLTKQGTTADTTSVADMEWWTIYNDTALQELITKALVYNKDLAMATSRMKELAAMKRIDFAKLFPEVNASFYNEREETNYGGDNRKADYEHSLMAKISWELDLWGNLRWAKDKSTAQFLASVENQRAVKMSLVSEVAQAYFELVALDNELSIVKQTLGARKESVRLAEIRFKGGLTSEIVYQQAQVELAKAETMVPELERKIDLKESEISLLAGGFPSHINRGIQPENVNLPDTLPVGLPSSLMERRPDIRKAEQELIAANAAIGVAYTNLFPRISLTANLGAESDVFSELLKSPYTFISGSVLTPIFGMGKKRAELKAKHEAYEEAKASYEKTVLTAFKEVHNAIVNFNKIKEIYESRRLLAESSKTTVELAQLQYINGVIGYLDLLDAQRNYLDAQISLSNSARDKRLAMVNLYKALGGGWQY